MEGAKQELIETEEVGTRIYRENIIPHDVKIKWTPEEAIYGMEKLEELSRRLDISERGDRGGDFEEE